MHGDLDWLATARPHDANISNYALSNYARQVWAIKALRQSSERLGLRLPEAFWKFMETPALQKRIRSMTDCFLNLDPAPVRVPVGRGYLIRFLANSQGCFYWYLYVTPDVSDHAVVGSPGLYDTEEGRQQDEPDPADIIFCAESFEAFLCQFWLENEIGFAEYEHRPMPDVCRAYIEQNRNRKMTPAEQEALQRQGQIEEDRRLRGLMAKDVSSLVEMLNQHTTRVDVLTVLGRKGPAAATAVPRLVELLRGGDQLECVKVLRTLEAIGPAARDAVPAVLELVDDPDYLIRLHARASLKAIT
jgi:hypothetical protein